MSAYYPNWSAVLKDIVKYITEFTIRPPIIAVEQTFKITVVDTDHYTIENITVPLSPILVYEITPTDILTYTPADKWETFLLLSGKNGVWSGRVPPGFGSVISINGKDGVLTIDKSFVGLSNVNNTADSDKPISNPTQLALNTKVNANAPITPGVATKVIYNDQGLVVGGTQATTNDIPDTPNRRYISDLLLDEIVNNFGDKIVDGGFADN